MCVCVYTCTQTHTFYVDDMWKCSQSDYSFQSGPRKYNKITDCRVPVHHVTQNDSLARPAATLVLQSFNISVRILWPNKVKRKEVCGVGVEGSTIIDQCIKQI